MAGITLTRPCVSCISSNSSREESMFRSVRKGFWRQNSGLELDFRYWGGTYMYCGLRER